MAEALPLADQPHLLQPNARKEDLFGIPKQPVTLTSSGKYYLYYYTKRPFFDEHVLCKIN